MTADPQVVYATERDLDVMEFRRVLVESGLGGIRPVGDETRLLAMLSAADLILTARLVQPGRPLVGIARCITDFAWCCYLSELAVAASAQGLGIGKGLLDEVRRQLGPSVAVILSSVPDAAGFYERVGMQRIADAFWYRRER
jgi:GNAT superfamily N-acetyltransferase